LPFAEGLEDLLIVGGSADFLAGGVEEVEFDFDTKALTICVIGECADSVGEGAAWGFFELDVADSEAGFGDGIFELNEGRVRHSGSGSLGRFGGCNGSRGCCGGGRFCFFLSHLFLNEMQGEEYGSNAKAEDENGDEGPDDCAAGKEWFLRGSGEEEFGGFAAVGAVNGHAGGFGGEFDVAAAVLAFAF